MFYETARSDHGLPHDPFKSLVVPRPIGWISTISEDGVVNLAPYSFFNAVSADPPYVMFSSAGRKDTITNAEATGAFVCSMATHALREAMNETSAPVPSEVDEFALAGLTPLPSRLVAPPRVAESPIALECRYHQTIELPCAREAASGYAMVIGEVVGVHIDDAVIREGRVDLARIRPLARLGYLDYTMVDDIFAMPRPE